MSAPTDVRELLQRGYRYALSLCHDKPGAEDLLQEGWARMLKAGGPRTTGYLFAAIRTRWVDEFRRGQVIAIEPLLEPERVSAHAVEADTLTAQRADLRQLLALLRPEEREVLFLSAVEGYTAAEIGELTSTPRNTVLSLLHRGRQRVRDHLNDGQDAGEALA